MMWQGGEMKLSSETPEGNIETTIPVQVFNGDGRIAIHIKYLLEYIEGKSGLVTMSTTTTTAPVVFLHSRSPLVAIMPMQVIWADQAVPEPVAQAEPTPVEENPQPDSGDVQEETTDEEPGEDEVAQQEQESLAEHEAQE